MFISSVCKAFPRFTLFNKYNRFNVILILIANCIIERYSRLCMLLETCELKLNKRVVDQIKFLCRFSKKGLLLLNYCTMPDVLREMILLLQVRHRDKTV